MNSNDLSFNAEEETGPGAAKEASQFASIMIRKPWCDPQIQELDILQDTMNGVLAGADAFFSDS